MTIYKASILVMPLRFSAYWFFHRNMQIKRPPIYWPRICGFLSNLLYTLCKWLFQPKAPKIMRTGCKGWVIKPFCINATYTYVWIFHTVVELKYLKRKNWGKFCLLWSINNVDRFRYSFVCQGTSTGRQRSDLFGIESSCHLLLSI